MNRPERLVRTAEVMGTVVSIHLRGASERTADGVAERCITDLRTLDRIFSTYRADSDLSRIRRGELRLADADPLVAEVAAACESAREATTGRFSAHWRGAFDPTGYVKGWAVEKVARAHLAPLVERGDVAAAAIGAGGDLQVFTGERVEETWTIGIVDPRDRTRTMATVDVRNGGIATSGIAERGAHIIDPRSGLPATSVASATVVCGGLADADVWATAAVVSGFDDLSWIPALADSTGILVAPDGRIRRWIGGVPVDVTALEAA